MTEKGNDMINKARDQILGEYFLNSFIIKCYENINFEKISESDTYDQLGSFLHEYIHFLQNASTTYGNKNMAYFYAKTMNILYKVKNSSDKEINRVIHCDPEIQFEGDVYNITMGNKDPWTYDSYDDIIITGTDFKSDEIYGEEYDQAVVPILELQLKKGWIKETKKFEFGALAIMESMASLLERHFYDKESDGKQPQYDICKILWNYLAPGYADREDLIAAACECSLMYENPGREFYTITKYFISREKKELNINDIADIFKKSFDPDFEQVHKKYFEEMNRTFCDLIPYKNNFCSFLNSYVSNFCRNLFEKRRENCHFLSDLMVMNSHAAKQGLIDIMNNTKAIPLIISKNNEVFCGCEQEDKMGMINYLAVYSFHNMFRHGGSNQCYMVDVCESMGENRVDDKCKSCPWEKVYEERLCPMAQIWYMWQLQGKKIVD